MHILIADDDALSRELLKFTLERAGHEVDVAHDGVEALESFKASRHPLVISDWEMPRMNGLELCRAIRAGEREGKAFILLLTARDGQTAIDEGLAAGADDFLAKPLNPQELRARVRVAQRIVALETAR